MAIGYHIGQLRLKNTTESIGLLYDVSLAVYNAQPAQLFTEDLVTDLVFGYELVLGQRLHHLLSKIDVLKPHHLSMPPNE